MDNTYTVDAWRNEQNKLKISFDVRLDTHEWLESRADPLTDEDILQCEWSEFDPDEFNPNDVDLSYHSDFEKFLVWLEKIHNINVGGIYGEGEVMPVNLQNYDHCLREEIIGMYFELEGEIKNISVSGSYLYIDEPWVVSGIWKGDSFRELGLLEWNRAVICCRAHQVRVSNDLGDWQLIHEHGYNELSDANIKIVDEIDPIRDEYRAREAEQRFLAAQMTLPTLTPPTLAPLDEKIILCEADGQLYCPHCLNAMEVCGD